MESIVSCRHCSSHEVHTVTNEDSIITHECTECEKQWYECVSCRPTVLGGDPRKRYRFDVWKEVKRHKYAHHKVDSPHNKNNRHQPIEEEQVPTDDDQFYICGGAFRGTIDDSNLYDEQMISLVDRFWDTLHMNCQSADLTDLPNAKYYSFYSNQQRRLGAACLINRSQNGVDITAALIPPREVLMHLRIAELVILLPKTQKFKLAHIFEDIESITKYRENQATGGARHSSSCSYINDISPPVLSFPPTTEVMRRTIIEGEHAILPNIPFVPVQQLENNHSYSSLIDIVKDLIATGNELDVTGLFHNPNKNSAVSSIGQTRRAQTIYQQSKLLNNGMVLTIYITLWSDDFEPNSVKQNKNSIWVLTCTISPPKHRTHTSKNTYIIAMGPKNACHDVVWHRLQQDLMILSSSLSGENRPSFYHCKLKKNIHIHADIHCILQDSPERRSCNYVSAGNGKYTALWGRSMDLLSIAEVVPSCQKCLFNRKIGKQSEKCSKCLDWELILPNELMQFPAPKDYPDDETLTNGKLNPSTITYASLCAAAAKSHNHIVSEKWKPKHAKAFLSVAGWNGQAKDNIVQHAVNALKWKEAIDNRETNKAAFVLMQQCFNADQSHFERWPMPSIMRGALQLDLFVEVPMHILFLNNVRNSVLLIIAWLKLSKKFTPFLKDSQGKLEQIQSLALSFCKALPFGKGTLGGYVSENHMVFARVGKWFFASIESFIADDPWVEPCTPMECWYVADLKAWLKARHYPYTATKEILQERIKNLMNQEGGPPAPLPPLIGQISLVKDLVMSLTSMVAHLMVQKSDDNMIQSAERHLKMYLSSYSNLEKAIRDHSKQIVERIPTSSDVSSGSGEDSSYIDDINNFDVEEENTADPINHNNDILNEVITATKKRKKKQLIPEWIQKHSVICMTNMIHNMREYGSARILWEGSSKGEGILKEIKPLVDKSSSNFIMNAHKKFHQRKGLKYLMSTLDTTSENINDHDDIGNDLENVRIYNPILIQSFLTQKKVVALVRLCDNRFIFVTNWKVGEGVVFMREKYYGRCWGADYFAWILGDGLQNFEAKNITHYCLFLPRLPSMIFDDVVNFNENPEHNLYFVITSQWGELMKSGEFVQYRNTILKYFL